MDDRRGAGARGAVGRTDGRRGVDREARSDGQRPLRRGDSHRFLLAPADGPSGVVVGVVDRAHHFGGAEHCDRDPLRAAGFRTRGDEHGRRGEARAGLLEAARAHQPGRPRQRAGGPRSVQPRVLPARQGRARCGQARPARPRSRDVLFRRIISVYGAPAGELPDATDRQGAGRSVLREDEDAGR